MTKYHRAAALLLGLTGAAVGAPCWAESPPSDSALEEIVVTARQRSERLIERTLYRRATGCAKRVSALARLASKYRR